MKVGSLKTDRHHLPLEETTDAPFPLCHIILKDFTDSIGGTHHFVPAACPTLPRGYRTSFESSARSSGRVVAMGFRPRRRGYALPVLRWLSNLVHCLPISIIILPVIAFCR